MIDLAILEKHGVTQENLKRKLSGDPFNKAPERGLSDLNYQDNPSNKEKVQNLLNRIRSRIQEGMTRNMTDWKHYYALDKAWAAPFDQLTPTLVSTFIDSDPNSDEVYAAFQQWGLTSLITTEPDPKDPNKQVRKLNLPVFFNVLVPLVKAYVTIRWAKIMNDRRLTPFFKYEPVKLTSVLQLLCDVITDRVQVMSNQYGYYDVQKQAVLKMLHYASCFQFPKEEWHYEEQLAKASKRDVEQKQKKPNGDPANEGEEILVTTKEGLRYHLPHPTRTFWDIAHGAYTFNYDCGCEYAGYWRIARYSEIEQNVAFWNRDRIALGTADLVAGNRLFFSSVYSACTLTLPTLKPMTMPAMGLRPPQRLVPAQAPLIAKRNSLGFTTGHSSPTRVCW